MKMDVFFNTSLLYTQILKERKIDSERKNRGKPSWFENIQCGPKKNYRNRERNIIKKSCHINGFGTKNTIIYNIFNNTNRYHIFSMLENRDKKYFVDPKKKKQAMKA